MNEVSLDFKIQLELNRMRQEALRNESEKALWLRHLQQDRAKRSSRLLAASLLAVSLLVFALGQLG